MIVNRLIEKAMEKAQGAQASLGQSESTNVHFENDKLKSVKSSQSTGMSIRIIVDGKIGSSHTTDIDDVDGVVARALEAAEFGSPAHFEFPGPQQGPDVKVYDDAVLPVTKGEMVRRNNAASRCTSPNSNFLPTGDIDFSCGEGTTAPARLSPRIFV